MVKILIIGSNGMAGHIIYNYFKENRLFEIADVARGVKQHIPTYNLDITAFDEMENVLKAEAPDVVINCIGLLNQYAENNPDQAILLNSYFPHFLARRGDALGFKLIHISTDCVFNGKDGSYTECSIKNGAGFYATTKALGEVNYGRHLTLRTSIIGPELKDTGIGLFDWFMKQQGKIKGYSRAFWTGVTTIELAKAIEQAIQQDISGLHHLVNDQKINKYDLLCLFKKIFEADAVEIIQDAEYAIDKSLVRTDHSFLYEVPSYEEMIWNMKSWISNHTELYQYSRSKG